MTQSKSLSKVPAAMPVQRVIRPLDPAVLADQLPASQENEGDYVAQLVVILGKLYRFCARKTDQKDLAIIADELYAEIRKSYPDLSAGEVERALFDGVRGMACVDYLELSMRMFSQWIDQYRQGAIRQQVKEARTPKNTPLIISELENRRAGIRLCCNFFSDYREGRFREGFAGKVFDILWREKILRPDEEHIQKLREQALREVHEELKNINPWATSYSDRASIRKTIDQLNRDPQSPNERVNSRMRMIIIREFFDGLIEMDMDVKELFSDELK